MNFSGTAYRLIVLSTGALLATLAFQNFSVTSQVRPGVNSQTPQTGPQANQRSDDFYAQRERNAAPEIRQKLEQFRREIQEQNLSFTVGYTTAMDRSMDQLAGTKIPDDLADQYRMKNALLGRNKNTDSQTNADALMVDASFQSSYSCNATASSFDWRDQGKVSPVRDQLGCGSCWAFATLGAFEGSYLLRSGVSDTSEQDVLSCSGAGNCKRGFWAYNYMMKTGTTPEPNAPYTATDGTCKSVPRIYKAESWGFVASTVAVGFAQPGPPDNAELKKALCHYGPISIALLSTPKFQAYTGGVFKENLPDSVRYDTVLGGKKTYNANHGVTLIGWDDRLGAWLIKNSWGKGWGEWAGPGFSVERGYGWVAYGSNNIGLAAAWVMARPLGFIKTSEARLDSKTIAAEK
jgi:C1A family cysteine protease